VLGITTYTIVPDVIVVYGCSCGGSLYGGSLYGGSPSLVVIPGLLHPATTVEQAIAGVQAGVVAHTGVVMHVVIEHIGGKQGVQVDEHVVASTHVVVGKHTVVVEGWHGGWMLHMGQFVVVITCVVVVQLVGQETVMMVVTVTVPTT